MTQLKTAGDLLTLLRLLAVATMVLLCACSGQSRRNPVLEYALQDHTAVAPEIAAGLPPLPDGKLAAETIGSVTEGSEVYDMSLNATVSATDLELHSTSNTTSWGVWQLSPGMAEPVSVEVVLTVPDGESAWVAISDYSTGTWRLDGPLSAGKQYPISSAANVSTGGSCFVAVITNRGHRATVNKFVFATDRIGWQLITVDNEGASGYYPSLAEVNGAPAIAYRSGVSIKYARSTTAAGASSADWNTILTINPREHPDEPRDISLATVNGSPAVCFAVDIDEISDTTLQYTRSVTSTGGAAEDWIPTVIVDDSAPEVGYSASLAEVDGAPAISYYDKTNGNLKYARSTTASGDSRFDWVSVAVDNATNVGYYNSLAVVSGNPAIAYYDSTNSRLKYARSRTSTGTVAQDWDEILVVDEDGNVGGCCSLTVVLDQPAILYWDYSEDVPKYKRAGTSTGTGFGAWQLFPLIIDDTTGGVLTNELCSLAVIAGKPAACYQSHGVQYQRSARSTGDGFNAWSSDAAMAIVGSDLQLISRTSLAEVDGKPAVAYQDFPTRSLMYAILLE